MTVEQALSFAAAAAVLTVLPGSDTLLVVRHTMRGGPAAGFLVSIGICLGLFVHATVSAIGMSAFLHHVPHGFQLLQGLGAAYLSFLGLRSLLAAWKQTPVAAIEDSGLPTISVPLRLVEGFLANVLNPKAMIFYIALLPQFLRPDDPVWVTSLLFAGIHWVEGMLWLGFLVLALDRVRPWLLSPRTQRILEAVSGTLLLGFGIRLAISRL